MNLAEWKCQTSPSLPSINSAIEIDPFKFRTLNNSLMRAETLFIHQRWLNGEALNGEALRLRWDS